MQFYKKLILLAPIIPCLLILAGCGGSTDPEDSTTGILQGTVTDRATSLGVPYVSITTVPPTESIVTDSNGNYRLEDLPPNTYTIIARKPGYKDAAVEVSVSAGKRTIGQVQLDSNRTGGTSRGWAIRYDGDDDYLSVPHSPALDLSDESFTVEAWVHPTALSNGSSLWNVILNKSHINTDLDYLLGINDHRQFSFITRSLSNFIRGSSTARVNTWYHVAGVQDVAAGRVMLYVNGMLEAQANLSGGAMHTDAPLFIGAREYLNQGRPSDMFQGVIDDVRIWNVARTQQQIVGSMYTSFTEGQAGLLASWSFEEGSGSITYDLSRSYVASMIGAPLWVVSSAPIQ